MIKILHLISDLDTGGAEIMLYRLVARMDRSKFSNVIVSMTNMGSLRDRIEALRIPVFALGMRRGKPNPFALLRLNRLLLKERPQVLQTWLYHADLLGLLAGRLSRVPQIAWNLRCSYVDFSRYPWTSKIVVRILAGLSSLPDAVVVNSEEGRRWHKELGYRPKLWRMIPNGFDLDQFQPDSSAPSRLRQELKVPEKSVLIGMVARFDPMKDYESFLAAGQSLLKQYQDVRLVLVGGDITEENQDITRCIARYGLTGYVYLLGERQDVPFIMSGLDILVNSSLGEGFPNVIGEAMACGTPCVVTDVGDSSLIVGEAGRVVPSQNPESLAQALAGLIELGEKGRERLGLAARQRIEEHFGLESVVGRYQDLYEKLSG